MKKTMLTILFAVSAIMAFAAAEKARINVYNLGEGNTMKIADKGTALRTIAPDWMKSPKRGGALAEFALKGSDWQTGTASFSAVGNGKLEIRLMGPDVRTKENPKENQKVYVDYSKVVVNGKTVYEGKNGKFLTVWHNAPHIIRNISVKDGDTVKIEATFRPSAKEE